MSHIPHSLARSLIIAITIGVAPVVSGCSAAAPAAAPTPTETSSPVRAVDLAEGDQDEPVQVAVDGGVEGVGVTFREITIEPGASTGEHCHYGQLIAVVAEGELTHYSDTHPGGVRVYRDGDSIIEGAGYPHEGRNEGDSDVVLWVTYVIPEGKPLAETDLALCDR
ncbi:cupin domain-containing protein [Microbacterium sp. Root61]|uniref:cupin domain-containing protein n=1 Tax=Microbacterium sp. Root61 TaxID=1736570 RepID=UPI0009E88BC7|nr:cupin domain-containing protein [Microbacterium sp. Root61]